MCPLSIDPTAFRVQLMHTEKRMEEEFNTVICPNDVPDR